jgi:uncharacterized membrane protein YgcG
MSHCKTFAFSIFTAAVLSCASVAQAQVSINIGVAPVCPYGYFDYEPYNCAPYGYYGPDWFVGGLFIGAGPWYHGHHGWYGHVDNRYDPRHGYVGPMPARGEEPYSNFHANEAHDGQGHVGNPGHDGGGEHSPGAQGGSHGGGGSSGGNHGGGGNSGGGHH